MALPSNASIAYKKLKQRILNNHYAVGATISVQDVEALLSMSRTPIRDALIRLEEERLIELVPRHGFRVLPVSVSEMIETYRIVTALEMLAIELLMERKPSADELNTLEGTVTGLEDALRAGNLDAWAKSDEAFHASLLTLSGNARLVETVKQFQDQTQRVRQITLHLRSTPSISTRNHRDVIVAIRSGDSQRACALHHAQRLRSGRELTKILQKLNIQQI